MSYLNPYEITGKWYKGNLHTHSNVSDGRLSVDDRFNAFIEKGYDFLALTDHGKVSDVSKFTSENFLAISGSELHPKNPYGGGQYHIVALNLHEPINTAKLHPNDVMAKVKELGGESIVGHPYWCGHNMYDLEPLKGYIGMEVYNATCTGIGKGFSEVHWDDLLDKCGPTLGFAVDDCHGTEHDVFRGWIMVKANELSLEAIMEAIVKGAFYSTTGPEIENIEVTELEKVGKDGKIIKNTKFKVECSPVRSIVFKSCRASGRRVIGEDLTSAEYVASSANKYVRIEITDANCQKAWSNPFVMRKA